MPTEPLTSHALHAPAQALLQQTPSTQCPEAHGPAPVHVAPLLRSATQRPAWQKRPAAHWPSLEQEAGQESLLPLQRYGAQEGAPGAPALTGAQVPVSHASHAPPHAVLQHTPPTQFPEAHCEALLQAAPLPPLLTQAPLVQL